MKEIKIYSTSWCPYCTKVKSFFERKGLPYTEIDLTHDEDALNQLMERTKHRTVPQVFIGETFVGGCDDVHELDAQGKLDQLLK